MSVSSISPPGKHQKNTSGSSYGLKIWKPYLNLHHLIYVWKISIVNNIIWLAQTRMGKGRVPRKVPLKFVPVPLVPHTSVPVPVMGICGTGPGSPHCPGTTDHPWAQTWCGQFPGTWIVVGFVLASTSYSWSPTVKIPKKYIRIY